MTTERSSFDDPGADATMDDAMGSVDRVTATRDVELESTGLSDAPCPQGAGTSTASSSSDWAGSSSGSTGSGSSGSGQGDRLQEAAGSVVDRVAGTAQQQVGTQVNSQLSRGADMLDQLGRAIRQSGETLRGEQPQMASLADTAAEQVDKATQFLRQNDFQGLVRGAEDFARRQPALFLGGALALGIVASRFLKASPSGGQGNSGGYGSQRFGGSYGSRSGYGASGYGGQYGGGQYGSGYDSGSGYGSGSSSRGGQYGGGSSYASAQANEGDRESGPYGGSGTGTSYAEAGSGATSTDEGAERGGI